MHQEGVPWVEALPAVLCSMRASPNRSVGLSPHEIITGRPMQMPGVIDLRNADVHIASDALITVAIFGLNKYTVWVIVVQQRWITGSQINGEIQNSETQPLKQSRDVLHVRKIMMYSSHYTSSTYPSSTRAISSPASWLHIVAPL